MAASTYTLAVVVLEEGTDIAVVRSSSSASM